MGALTIDVTQHEDIAAAAATAAAASTEEPPRAEVVISVAGGLEALNAQVSVLVAENAALAGRVLALETQGVALLAWAVALTT